MKKNKKIKNALCLLLSAVMCLSLFGGTVFAEEGAEGGTHIITGFAGLNDSEKQIRPSAGTKPSLEELLAQMPETLDVYLDGSTELTSIPVTWFCVGEDYETSDGYYFQFSPQWDENTYTLSEDLELLTDAPYIGVFLSSESDISLYSVTDIPNETAIFEFLVKEMNFNNAVASGILANIYYESTFDHLATGDNGTSHGICQWHAARWDALTGWCQENGYDPNTLDGQLHYLQFELSNNDYRYLYNGKTISDYLRTLPNTADGAYEAGRYWCYYYEVPANRETVSVTRGNLARNTYWPEYVYSDVHFTDWFSSDVVYVHDNQLMTGYGDGSTFGPYDYLARAQFALILHRIENEPAVSTANPFPDVAENAWYRNAVVWVNETGIATGYSNGNFGPADSITREQMAVMMYHYAQLKGYDTSVTSDFSQYQDASSVSDFAIDAMRWAVGNNIITGKYNETMLDPQGRTTRAECATILTRFMEQFADV